MVDSANYCEVIGPAPTSPLAYSTQPVKSRVLVERDPAGFVTITVLPATLRSLALLSLLVDSIGVLSLVSLILYFHYGSPMAVLLLRPAAAVGWALLCVGLTLLFAAFTVVVSVVFFEQTTTVRVRGDALSVRCRWWYWQSRRELPLLLVHGTRVTPLNRLAVVDADGKTLCKLSVPDTVDLPWLSRVLLDAVAYGQGMPEPAASRSTRGGLE